MRLVVLLLALLTPVLAACSGSGDDAGDRAQVAAHEEDQAVAEWRTAVEDELGTDTFDFEALRQAAAVDCMRLDAQAWSVELALSGDVSTSGLTRVGLEHACPDVVRAFDEAVTTVEQSDDPLELVCGPGVELSSEDALRADLVCADR